MSSRGTWIDDEILAAIDALFPDPEAAYAVAGIPAREVFPYDWKSPVADITEPIIERLYRLDRLLRDHLRLLADQMPEFAHELDHARIRGEALAVLISLRELHRLVPELDSGA